MAKNKTMAYLTILVYNQINICYNTLGDYMQSILGEISSEFIEKKSRFIGIIYHVESVDDALKYLDKVKSIYPGATHYVYAYIINETNQKASDDGEPQRTAGYPVLDVLKKNNLNDCIAIVIRYFGGIKLGAGGLIRAYSHSIALAIEKATFIQKVTRYACSLKTAYPQLTQIERILRENTQNINADYGEYIVFKFDLFDYQFENIKTQLFNANQFKDDLIVINKDYVYAKVSDSYIQTMK